MAIELSTQHHRQDAAEMNAPRLHIDNVLSSQSEMGPQIPDGGYGWIVLLATFYIKTIIPGLALAYGLFLLFFIIESGASVDSLWSNNFIATPVLFIAAQTLTDPICFLIVRNSKWPRFVFLSGVCLTSASILMLWLAVIDGLSSNALPVLSGAIAGFSTSLILLQANVIINQYFHLKLSRIKKLLRSFECFGLMATSLILGRYLNTYGIAYSIVWYNLFVLLCGLVALIIRKPNYLKGRSVYNIVTVRHCHNAEEDEEDVFSKTETELQSPHSSLPPNVGSINEQSSKAVPIRRENWERFSDDEEDGLESQLEAPRELFADSQINNNVTYSFDNSENVHIGATDNIFLPNPHQASAFAFFRLPSFYSICLLQIVLQIGRFAFFTLYPSYIYYSVTFLHKGSVPYVIAIIILPLLTIALFIDCLKISLSNRALHIALCLWFSGIGNVLVCGFRAEVALIIGGIFISISLYALDFICHPLVLNNGKRKIEYACTKMITGSAVLVILFTSNLSYENYFRFMGLLQFVTGAMWFCSFVYNKFVA